jgi:hypothetical protein
VVDFFFAIRAKVKILADTALIAVANDRTDLASVAFNALVDNLADRLL